ncbi:hypothetical protein Y032_0072g680 [Ancylostoma ceylanicum]|uniref:Uncharacterized protein n=1 Tax=Ancylostoma ceylanicum TaxID=53326 RepID=A0A016TWB1_9BILA|nr:hypothetical protein Y032_0072g680 [Ancylostoma ceylanicum]
MVFSAPIHLAPTQVKQDGNVVVTTSESTHVEAHRTVTHHEEHHSSSFYTTSHQSHSESRQIHTGGHVEASSVVESEHFNDLESERHRTASPTMSTATSVSVRSSVSQQRGQYRDAAKQEARSVTVQSYAVNKIGGTSDGDESTVTVVSSHRHTDGAPTPTVESEASTTVAPVRSSSHDAVIEQFKSLHKRESIASSVQDQEEQNHHKHQEHDSSAVAIGEGVKSIKVTQHGFDSTSAHQKHSHSQQEAPEDLHVLRYKELDREPLKMTSDSGSVHVVERHEHHEEYHTGTEIRTHESEDEPFTFEKVEYVTERSEVEPCIERISHENIECEGYQEKSAQASQAHSRAASESYSQGKLRTTSSHHSSSHEVSQQQYSSQERAKQSSQQSLASTTKSSTKSSTKAYEPYAQVADSHDYKQTKDIVVSEQELVPHLVGPKVRDDPRPVTLADQGVYKITEYKFVSRSDQQKDGSAHVQKSSESETHRRHSQSRHSHKEHKEHKEHRHTRAKPIDMESLRSSSQDDIEIRTEMHMSPASTLVRQSQRPDPDLPPETGAVKMLRQRIELGESNKHHSRTTKEIDIFESLDANKNYKGEDIPRSEINEQNRHTFHELYYRGPIETNIHLGHGQYRHSTVVNSVHDGHVQQHVEPYQEVNLRHVGQTSGRQSFQESNQQIVNLRHVGQVSGRQSIHESGQQQVNLRHVGQTSGRESINESSQQLVNLRHVGQVSGRESVSESGQQLVNLRHVDRTSGRQSINESSQQLVNLRHVGQAAHTRDVHQTSTVHQGTKDIRGQSVQSAYSQGRNELTQHHQETSKQVHSYSTAHNPSGPLVCTCNSCAIHGRNAQHHAGAVTKRTEEVRELDYNRAGYQKSASQTSQTSHTANKFVGSGAVVQKTDQHDDSRTHKRTSSIHRIEDVVHSAGGVHVSGVVGNVVDTRSAQGEVYTTRTAYRAPQVQQRSVTSHVVSSPPTAAARMSRPQNDEKFNSMRVVKNVRSFVSEWGQKDFVPPYPAGAQMKVSSPTRNPVTPTFTETKVTTTTHSVSGGGGGAVQRVALPGMTKSRAESAAQSHTQVTKEQTIVKTEAHHVGKV